MAKFDSVESVKAKYEAGERVFTSHEVMVLLTRISHLENAAQQSVQADGAKVNPNWRKLEAIMRPGLRRR